MGCNERQCWLQIFPSLDFRGIYISHSIKMVCLYYTKRLFQIIRFSNFNLFLKLADTPVSDHTWRQLPLIRLSETEMNSDQTIRDGNDLWSAYPRRKWPLLSLRPSETEMTSDQTTRDGNDIWLENPIQFPDVVFLVWKHSMRVRRLGCDQRSFPSCISTWCASSYIIGMSSRLMFSIWRGQPYHLPSSLSHEL